MKFTSPVFILLYTHSKKQQYSERSNFCIMIFNTIDNSKHNKHTKFVCEKLLSSLGDAERFI